jgi:hypothetical protein
MGNGLQRSILKGLKNQLGSRGLVLEKIPRSLVGDNAKSIRVNVLLEIRLFD